MVTRATRVAAPVALPLAVTLTSAGHRTTLRIVPRPPWVTEDTVAARGEGFRYSVTFPQLRDVANPEVQNRVNRAIRSEVDELVADFLGRLAEVERVPGDRCVLVATYRVRMLDAGAASLLLDTHVLPSGVADVRPINFELATGRHIALRSLFREGSDWLGWLSRRSRAELLEQLKAHVGPGENPAALLWEEGVAPEEANFERFALTDEALEITFGAYQVSPLANGLPVVRIPWHQLAPLLAGDAAASSTEEEVVVVDDPPEILSPAGWHADPRWNGEERPRVGVK